jgi:hypothetical protein
MKKANEALELTNQRVDYIHREQQIKKADEWKTTLKTIKGDITLFKDNILSSAIDKAINDGSYDVVICISKYNMRTYDTYNHYVHGTLAFEEYNDKMVEAFVDMLTNTLGEEYQYNVMSRKNSSDIIDPKLDTDDDYYTISVRWSEVKDDDYDIFADEPYDTQFEFFAS